MGQPETNDPIPLSVPILGLNRKDPLAKMDPQYSPWLLNWEPEAQYLRIRNGWIREYNFAALTDIFALQSDGNYIYAYGSAVGGGAHEIYRHDDLINPAFTLGGNAATSATPGKFSSTITFMADINGFVYSAALLSGGWALWTLGDAGINVAPGMSLVGFKGRAYTGMAYAAGKFLNYYDFQAIQNGTMAQVSLDYLFDNNQAVRWIKRLTSPSMRADELFLAFGNYAGEILVYAGDNPDADNWEQIGEFQTSKPLWFSSALEYKNDVWIPTETGIVSLKKLFTQGSQGNEDISVSGAIDDYWTELSRARGGSSVKCSMVYWPEQNKIYVLRPGFIDEDGTYTSTDATLFVHNPISGAWVPQRIAGLHPTANAHSLLYHNNGLYFATGIAVMKLEPDTYADGAYNVSNQTNAFATPLQSAYMNLGSEHKYKKTEGFQPIIKTDFDGSKVGMQAASDFGRKVSSTSYSNLQDGYQIANYNVGAEGTFLQYRFDGVSDISSTDGYKLYSVGMNIS